MTKREFQKGEYMVESEGKIIDLTPGEYVIRAVQTESKNWPEIHEKMGFAPTHSTVTAEGRRYLRLLHASFGFVTETGELVDALKRYTFYGKKVPSLDLNNIAEEAGDLLWYMAILFDEFGWTFGQIMAANIRKLQDKDAGRYKKGTFLSHDAVERNPEAEQAALAITMQNSWKGEGHAVQPIQVGPGPNGDYGIPFDGGSGTTPSPETLDPELATIAEDMLSIQLFAAHKAAQWGVSPREMLSEWNKQTTSQKEAWLAVARHAKTLLNR